MWKRLGLVGAALVIAPGLALAQMPPGMQGMDPAEMMRRFQDPAAMERMAKEAEAAQQCMKGISQAELDALQKKGEQASAEIDRLCKAGKRAEALAKGLALSAEMRRDPTVKKLRKCTEGMAETQQMLQSMPWARVPGVTDDDAPTDDDICS